MQREEFVEKYKAVIERVLLFTRKSRPKGIIALEGVIDEKKLLQRDVFEYGIFLAVEGFAAEIIDEILFNIINLEKDDDEKLLKIIQKEAVLKIQQGCKILELIFWLNSYVDIEFKEMTDICKYAYAYSFLENKNDKINLEKIFDFGQILTDKTVEGFGLVLGVKLLNALKMGEKMYADIDAALITTDASILEKDFEDMHKIIDAATMGDIGKEAAHRGIDNAINYIRSKKK
jgi:hypothetical protein